MSISQQTHNPDDIQKWAGELGGVPAKIKSTVKRIPAFCVSIFRKIATMTDQFEKIDWETFFEIFNKHKLDLLYQDTKKDDKTTTFHKFVSANKTFAKLPRFIL